MNRKSLFLTCLLPVFIVLMAFLPNSAYSQSQPLTKVKFCLDWAWQGSHSAWAIADDLGYFKKEGLDLTIDRGYGSASTMSKVAAKAYDIGYAPINGIIKFNYENPQDQLIMVLNIIENSPEGVIFLNKSKIKSPADLSGKTMAATMGEGTYLMFPLFAKANNLDMKKIQWKYVEPQLRDAMVLQGHADATVGFVTTTAINMVRAGIPMNDIGYLMYHSYGIELYSSGLVARKDFVEKNPKIIQAFIRGTIGGVREMISNPEKAVESLKKRDPMLDSKIELMRIQMLKDMAIFTPHVQKNGISDISKTRFEKSAKSVAQAFGINVQPKLEDVYTDKYLPAKADRMLNK